MNITDLITELFCGDCNTANVHGQTFQPLLACCNDQMIILAYGA